MQKVAKRDHSQILKMWENLGQSNVYNGRTVNVKGISYCPAGVTVLPEVPSSQAIDWPDRLYGMGLTV